MPITLPVRVFPVYAGASADDPARRQLFTCRDERGAHDVVVTLEKLKATGLVLDDVGQQFFYAAADVDMALEVSGVADAIAQGYAVRSVVLVTADVPKEGVLGTLAGATTEDASLPDPAEAQPAPQPAPQSDAGVKSP